MAANAEARLPAGLVVTTSARHRESSEVVVDAADKMDKKHLDGTEGLSKTQVVVTSLAAGATAGALAKTTIAPLDRTKINFQTSKLPYSAKAAFRFIAATAKADGVIALWRGNSATMARILPYAAIQFTAHEQWKQLFGVSDTSLNRRSPGLLFVSGSLAGVTSQSLTYPLDLARARLAVTSSLEYKGLWQVFSKIWTCEGPSALYRGYLPTILGVIPYAGVSFFTYDSLKHAYRDHYGEKQPALVNLLFGGIAGMLGQSSSYPLDIVRRRMQTARRDKEGKYQYTTIIGTLKKIYREEGVKGGFFKGLSMNWVKGPVAVGMSFASYDSIRSSLREICTAYNAR